MHVEGDLHALAHRGNDGRSERDVVDEMAVHDIEVQPVRARGRDALRLVAKLGEIARQQRGRDDDPLVVHCLTFR